MYPILFKFLLDKNALLDYKSNTEIFNTNHYDNIENRKNYLKKYEDTKHIIDISFNWRNTIQGHDYWKRLNKDYVEYLNSFKNGC